MSAFNAVQENICPTCDREFSSDRGMKVHHAKAHGESLAKETSECEYCGSLFEYYTSQDRPFRACSDECRGKSISEGKSLGETEECSYCNQTIPIEPHERELKNRFFCDMDCKAKWQTKNARGEDCPSWKGGWEKYYGEDWLTAREACRKRDHYQCRVCGKDERDIGRIPDVHHIVPVREYRDEYGDRNLANRMTNLITLCPKHHSGMETGEVRIPLTEVIQNVSIC